MDKRYITKTFVRFLVGFVVILGASFVVILVASNYK